MITFLFVCRRSLIAPLLLAGFFLLATGCHGWRDDFMDDNHLKSFYRPANFNGVKILPADMRRVLVLPAYGGPVAEREAAAALDEALLVALQKTARFEVVTISREELQRRFGQQEFSSAAVLPRGFLEELGRIHGADAVLFVDLTLYQPYPPVAVGFRAKLATIQEVKIVWTFDDSFSSANPAVVNSLKRASRKEGSSAMPVDMSVGILQSPRRFASYAADAMFDTLPPR